MDIDSRINQFKKKRGFAAMSKEKQREIASLGGKAAHEKGVAHEFTPEEAKVAGQKGGMATQKSRISKILNNEKKEI